jgi:hypothetical protein
MNEKKYTEILENWHDSVELLCKKIDEAGGWPTWANQLMFRHVIGMTDRPTVWANNWATQDGKRHYSEDWYTQRVTLDDYKKYHLDLWKKENALTVQTVNEAIELFYKSVQSAKNFNPKEFGRDLEEAARIGKMAVEKLKTAAVMVHIVETKNV